MDHTRVKRKRFSFFRIGLTVLFIVGFFVVSFSVSGVLAATDSSATDSSATGSIKQEIDDLQAQVKEHEKQAQELEAAISKYNKQIKLQEAAVDSLQNQVALLENRIAEKQLAVQQTKNQIELTNLQIQTLNDQIGLETARLARRRASLAELLGRIQEASSVSPFDALLTHPSLSDFFARLDQLKRIESELGDATKSVRELRMSLEDTKKHAEEQRQTLEEQKAQLQKDQDALEGDRSAKVSLVAETQNKEEEYRRIVYELHQQQQADAGRAAELQDQLKDKLNSIDQALARGDILLNWPLAVVRGIAAEFHDPTYPFRRLFEHPGIDLPTSVGTPVMAAAGGYVAWNKTGKQYGNYVMLVHPGGIATVYAHLSRFAAQPDTYVERGDIIGYSGGKPGDQGAGLSTGPHLHFEVRQNGIPVNPENFLPNL